MLPLTLLLTAIIYLLSTFLCFYLFFSFSFSFDYFIHFTVRKDFTLTPMASWSFSCMLYCIKLFKKMPQIESFVGETPASSQRNPVTFFHTQYPTLHLSSARTFFHTQYFTFV